MIGKDILICGYPHRTEHSDILQSEESAIGIIYHDLDLIRISRVAAVTRQKRALFEEVIHGICGMHDLDLDKADTQHHEIVTLATMLLRFLIDNPEWVEWLMAKEGKDDENNETSA